MVTLVCIIVYGNLRPTFTPEEAVSTAGAVLVCQSSLQQIVAMQYIILCLCVYTYVCVQRLLQSCSFSMQLCNNYIALFVRLSQSNKLQCILHPLKLVSCDFTFVVYACCGCLSMQLISHTFQLSNARLSLNLPCACGTPVFPWGATSSPRAFLN